MTVLDHPTTRPTTTAPSVTPARSSRIARWNAAALDRLGALTATQLAIMIWLSALIMCLTLLGSSRTSINGTMNIVENWGAVERVALWQDFVEPVIPRFTLPTGVIAWGFRAGMVLGFLAQIGAFLVVLRTRNPSLKRWLVGPLGAHVIMTLLMIPSNSDVFFYEAVGDLAANGINPYVHHLIEFPDHPLLPYNYWVDIGTVYGPHWVNYNAIVMAVTGPDPVVATLVQKVLSGLTTFALVWLVYWLAKRLSGSQSLAAAAGVLVAWQPNMILETSGQVHNDPLVVLLATAGLALVITGGVGALRGGIVLVSLSIMVKFITLPLLGVLALIRLTERRRPDAARRILGGWVLDGVAILAVFAGAFLPYWEGFKTVQEMLAEPSRLFTHPIWRFIQSALGFLFPHQVSDAYNAITRPLLQVMTFVLFGWVIYRLVMAFWDTRETVEFAADGQTDVDTLPDALPWWTKPVLVAWTAMFCILGFLPVNSHPWYWVWPVVPIATLVAFLLRDTRPLDRIARMPGWFWLYVWGNGLLTVMYHTRIARY
jgi:hypothetical protein